MPTLDYTMEIPFTDIDYFMTDIENFPVSQLPARYNIGKSQLYNRLKRLNIKPYFVSSKSYVTFTELELLDELHNFIKGGGTIKDFLKDVLHYDLEDKQDYALVNSIPVEITAIDFVKVLMVLDEFKVRGWLITTKQLALLLNKSPNTFYGKKYYNYRGFKLRRLEDSTNESTWEITK